MTEEEKRRKRREQLDKELAAEGVNVKGSSGENAKTKTKSAEPQKSSSSSDFAARQKRREQLDRELEAEGVNLRRAGTGSTAGRGTNVSGTSTTAPTDQEILRDIAREKAVKGNGINMANTVNNNFSGNQTVNMKKEAQAKKDLGLPNDKPKTVNSSNVSQSQPATVQSKTQAGGKANTSKKQTTEEEKEAARNYVYNPSRMNQEEFYQHTARSGYVEYNGQRYTNYEDYYKASNAGKAESNKELDDLIASQNSMKKANMEDMKRQASADMNTPLGSEGQSLLNDNGQDYEIAKQNYMKAHGLTEEQYERTLEARRKERNIEDQVKVTGLTEQEILDREAQIKDTGEAYDGEYQVYSDELARRYYADFQMLEESDRDFLRSYTGSKMFGGLIDDNDAIERLSKKYGVSANEVINWADYQWRADNAQEAEENRQAIDQLYEEHPVIGNVLASPLGVGGMHILNKDIGAPLQFLESYQKGKAIKDTGATYLGADPNSPYNSFQYMGEEYADEFLEGSEDWQKNVYYNTISGIESADYLRIAGNVANAASALGASPTVAKNIGTAANWAGMGMSAGSQTYRENIMEGASDEEAKQLAAAAAAAEIIGESISLSALQSMEVGDLLATRQYGKLAGRLALNAAKSYASEGTEEGVTEGINIYAENKILGQNSKHNKAVRGYMNAGYSEPEAKKQAYIDDAEDRVLPSVFWGGLMGMGLGTVASFNNGGYAATAARAANQAIADNRRANLAGQEIATRGRGGEYLAAADAAGGDVQSYKNKVVEKRGGEQNLTQKDIGKIAMKTSFAEERDSETAAKVQGVHQEYADKRQGTKQQAAIDAADHMQLTNPEITVDGKKTRIDAKNTEGGKLKENVGTDGTYKAADIVSGEKGNLTVKTTDRRTVKLTDDVINSIGNEETKTLMRFAVNKNLGADSTNLLIDTYDGSVKPEEHAEAFEHMYKLAQAGGNLEIVMGARGNTEIARSMFTEAQINAIDIAAKSEKEIKPGATDWSTKTKSKLVNIQKGVINNIAKIANKEVILVDNLFSTFTNEEGKTVYRFYNGSALTGENRILLSVNSQKGLLLSYLGHELGHMMKAEDTALFNSFADKVKQHYGKDWEKEKAKFVKLGYDATVAEEEVACNAFFDVFTGKDLAEMFGTKEAVAIKAFNLISKISDEYNRRLNEYMSETNRSGELKHSDIAKLMSDKELLDEAKATMKEYLNKAQSGKTKTPTEVGERYSIANTQSMTWNDQIGGLLSNNGTIKHSDTLVVSNNTPSDITAEGVNDKILAIPISIISKAKSGSNTDHTIEDENLQKLDKGIENAPIAIINPVNNTLSFITDIKQKGKPIFISFAQDKDFDGDKNVHTATTIHLRSNVEATLKNAPAEATILVRNKKALDTLLGTSSIIEEGLTANIKYAEDNTTPGAESQEKTSINDEEYMAAVKSNDQPKLKQMVKAAAEKAGYTEEVYHGTTAKEIFNVFYPGGGQYGPGTYVSYDDNIAEGYGRRMDLFVKISNIADYDDVYKMLGKTEEESLDSFAQKLGFDDYDTMLGDWDNDPTDVVSNSKLIPALIDAGFEGFVDDGNGGFVLWDIPGFEARIKLADPITYDDNGNVIPLSQRFNENNNDIRYSVSDVEDLNKDSEPKDVYLSTKDVRYHLAYYESGDHIKALDKAYNSKEAELSKDELVARYDKIVDIWRQLGGELNSEFLNKWNNQEITKSSFEVFKSQTGYKYNIELSTMCKKGIPLFEAIDTIVKQEVSKQLKSKKLGKAEKEILYDILKKHSFEIPCAICYVEQARQREGDIIEAFLNGKESDGKIGWNTTLDAIAKRMKSKGVDYSFPSVSSDIATDNYSPADLTMDEKTEQAFMKAMQLELNKEIAKTNEKIKIENEKAKKRAEKKGEEPKLKQLKPMLKNSSYEEFQRVFASGTNSNIDIFKVLLNNPDSRFKMDSDPLALYSSFTTLNLSNNHHDLYSLFNQQGGVSTFKTKQRPIAYMGELLGKNRWNPTEMRGEGGIRTQSNSDFQMYTLMDLVQEHVDLTAKGFYLQGYTKVPAELKLFGLSGDKLNGSVIPAVYVKRNADGSIDEDWTRENAGLDENGNLIFDSVEGINPEEVFMLVMDKNYSKGVTAICIGYSDKQIFKMLDDKRIGMIIGFHDKTDDPAKRYYGARYAKNYNGLNEATKKKGGETVHIAFNQFIIQAEDMFNGNKNKTVKHNGQTYAWKDVPKLGTELYLDYCEQKGLYPAYYNVQYDGMRASEHPNYYKLLADFGLYDSEGNYAPQEKVKLNMPDMVPVLENGKVIQVDTKEYIKNQLKGELQVRDKIAEALNDKSEDGIIPEFVRRANELNEKQKADVKYSVNDEEYAPTFYSQMGKVVEGVKQDKLSVNGLINMLKGKGVKDEEIQWSGIEEWLADKGKSVTKQELQDFIKNSMLNIEAITLEDEHGEAHVEKISDSQFYVESPRGERLDFFYDEDSEMYFSPDTVLEFESPEEAESYFTDPYLGNEEEGNHNTRWYGYKTEGGENYREILFTVPGSEYSNQSMDVHWGRPGVLAHARIQDMPDADGNKMLFIDEIQSDWHNAAEKKEKGTPVGYMNKGERSRSEVSKELQKNYAEFKNDDAMRLLAERVVNSGSEAVMDIDSAFALLMSANEHEMKQLENDGVSINESESKTLGYYREKQKELLKEYDAVYDKAAPPDAPFKNGKYVDYVLKNLLRMAAENGYDKLAWTPSEMQSKRWSDKFAEGYRIEYDQDMPKFLNKFGKKFGAKVGISYINKPADSQIKSHQEDIDHLTSLAETRKAKHGENDSGYLSLLDIIKNHEQQMRGTPVWSIDITPEMKESVLYEGQAMYSVNDDEFSYKSLTAKPDMKLTALTQKSVLLNNGKYDRIDLVNKGIANVQKVGGVNEKGNAYVHVADNNKDVIVSNNALKHGLDRRAGTQARVIPHIGDILKNSIQVNELNPKNQNASESYMLLGAAKDESDNIYVVDFVVNRFTNEVESVDVLYSADAKKEAAGLSPTSSGAQNETALSVPASSIRIADLLEIVKDVLPRSLSQDVLAHFGQTRGNSELEQGLKHSIAYTIGEEELEANEYLDNASDAEIKSVVDAVDRELLGDAMYYGRTLGEQKQKTKQKVREQRAKDVEYYHQRMKEIRADRDQKLIAQKIAYKKAQAKKKEQSLQRDYRNKIWKKYNNLSKMMTHPTEKQHVPQHLVSGIAEFLEGFSTNLLQEETRKDGTTIKSRAQKNNKLINLIGVYQSLQNDPTYADVYDEDVKLMLQKAYDDIGSTAVNDMNSVELEQVYNALSAIENTIRRANKIIIAGKERDATESAQKWIKQIRNARGRHKAVPVGAENTYKPNVIDRARGGMSAFWQAQEDPMRMFRSLDRYRADGVGQQLGKMLNEAKRQHRQILQTIDDKFQHLTDDTKQLDKLRSTKKEDLVDVGLKSYNNKPVLITRDMMLGMYKDLLNEQNTRHVVMGGYVVPNLQEYYHGDKAKSKADGIRVKGLSDRLFDINKQLMQLEEAGMKGTVQYENLLMESEDLYTESALYAAEMRTRIEGMLTDYEKEWLADSEWLNDEYGKNSLNEATMYRYGFKVATEDNYYHIDTVSNLRKGKSATDNPAVATNFSIENIGSMKERVKGAANPIYLNGLTEALREQAKTVADYSALMPAIWDFNKVYERTTRMQQEGKDSEASTYLTSVKEAITDVWDDKTVKYINNLLADLQGGRGTNKSAVSKIFGKLRGNAAQAMLTINPRVALAQAASYPTASVIVGRKALAKAFLRGGKGNTIISRADRELIKKYSGALEDRYAGIAKTSLSNIRENSAITSRVLKKTAPLTNWLQKIDEATVGRLWYAAQYYVDDNYKNLKKGTDAYYKQVAEIFDQTVENTQPNFSNIMHRSAALRTDNELFKTFTMFMTQRSQNFNILYDSVMAYHTLRQDLKNGATDVTKAQVEEAKDKMISGISSQLVAAVTLGVMKVVVDMFQHNMKAYRDDDDEVTEQETLEKLFDTIMDCMSSTVILGSEAYTALKSALTKETYYGMSVNILSTFEDFSKDLVNMVNNFSGKSVYKTVKDLCNLTGIPVVQGEKWVNMIRYWAEDVKDGGKIWSNYEGTEGTKQVAGKIIRASQNGDLKQQKYYTDMLNERVENEELSDDGRNNGFRNYIKDKYVAKDIDRDEAVKLIGQFYNYGDGQGQMISKDKANEIVDKWDGIEPETTKTKTEKMIDAYLQGDMSAYKAQSDSLSGDSATAVKSAITSYVQEKFIAGDLDDEEAKRIFVDVYGKSEEDAEKKVEEFRKRKNGTYEKKESKKWGDS